MSSTLVVTTICFVDRPREMIAEAGRVLRPGGMLVIGFVDRQSAIGKAYAEHAEESVFYSEARFFSVAAVADLLRDGGFRIRSWCQTLFRPLPGITEIEPVRPGTGRGAFIAVAADGGSDEDAERT